MTPTILTALLIEFLAGLALHLSSPHQRMLVRPLRAKPARLVGAALLVIALAAFLSALHPAVAVYVHVTWLMLLFVLFPYAGALLALRQGR